MMMDNIVIAADALTSIIRYSQEDAFKYRCFNYLKVKSCSEIGTRIDLQMRQLSAKKKMLTNKKLKPLSNSVNKIKGSGSNCKSENFNYDKIDSGRNSNTENYFSNILYQKETKDRSLNIILECFDDDNNNNGGVGKQYDATSNAEGTSNIHHYKSRVNTDFLDCKLLDQVDNPEMNPSLILLKCKQKFIGNGTSDLIQTGSDCSINFDDRLTNSHESIGPSFLTESNENDIKLLYYGVAKTDTANIKENGKKLTYGPNTTEKNCFDEISVESSCSSKVSGIVLSPCKNNAPTESSEPTTNFNDQTDLFESLYGYHENQKWITGDLDGVTLQEIDYAINLVEKNLSAEEKSAESSLNTQSGDIKLNSEVNNSAPQFEQSDCVWSEEEMVGQVKSKSDVNNSVSLLEESDWIWSQGETSTGDMTTLLFDGALSINTDFLWSE